MPPEPETWERPSVWADPGTRGAAWGQRQRSSLSFCFIIHLVYICYIFYFYFTFWPHHAACGTWFPDPGSNPRPPQWKHKSPKHWPAMELPLLFIYKAWLSCLSPGNTTVYGVNTRFSWSFRSSPRKQPDPLQNTHQPHPPGNSSDCPSLGSEWKQTSSSPVATAEFSKFAGILSAAPSQHHLLEFEIAQLEFHLLH